MITPISRYNPTSVSRVLNNPGHYTIGLDQFFNNILSISDVTPQDYPRYNLLEEGNTIRLEMTLSGYTKSNIKVYTEKGLLVVEGNKESEQENVRYLHRGIARRPFVWKRLLPDNMIVKEAKLEDGLLVVNMEKVVPEELQRKDYL
jgi:molecular chaperone IbpA